MATYVAESGKVSSQNHEYLLDWLTKELVYVDKKFPSSVRGDHSSELEQTGVSFDSYWFQQVYQYVKRAEILGLDNPLGRQAIAKGLSTMFGLVERVIEVYGELPPPGVSSGNL
jgi:hypothetical protein